MAWGLPGRYLNQRWLVYWCIYAFLGLNELNWTRVFQGFFLGTRANIAQYLWSSLWRYGQIYQERTALNPNEGRAVWKMWAWSNHEVETLSELPPFYQYVSGGFRCQRSSNSELWSSNYLLGWANCEQTAHQLVIWYTMTFICCFYNCWYCARCDAYRRDLLEYATYLSDQYQVMGFALNSIEQLNAVDLHWVLSLWGNEPVDSK